MPTATLDARREEAPQVAVPNRTVYSAGELLAVRPEADQASGEDAGRRMRDLMRQMMRTVTADSALAAVRERLRLSLLGAGEDSQLESRDWTVNMVRVAEPLPPPLSFTVFNVQVPDALGEKITGPLFDPMRDAAEEPMSSPLATTTPLGTAAPVQQENQATVRNAAISYLMQRTDKVYFVSDLRSWRFMSWNPKARALGLLTAQRILDRIYDGETPPDTPNLSRFFGFGGIGHSLASGDSCQPAGLSGDCDLTVNMTLVPDYPDLPLHRLNLGREPAGMLQQQANHAPWQLLRREPTCWDFSALGDGVDVIRAGRPFSHNQCTTPPNNTAAPHEAWPYARSNEDDKSPRFLTPPGMTALLEDSEVVDLPLPTTKGARRRLAYLMKTLRETPSVQDPSPSMYLPWLWGSTEPSPWEGVDPGQLPTVPGFPAWEDFLKPDRMLCSGEPLTLPAAEQRELQGGDVPGPIAARSRSPLADSDEDQESSVVNLSPPPKVIEGLRTLPSRNRTTPPEPINARSRIPLDARARSARVPPALSSSPSIAAALQPSRSADPCDTTPRRPFTCLEDFLESGRLPPQVFTSTPPLADPAQSRPSPLSGAAKPSRRSQLAELGEIYGPSRPPPFVQTLEPGAESSRQGIAERDEAFLTDWASPALPHAHPPPPSRPTEAAEPATVGSRRCLESAALRQDSEAVGEAEPATRKPLIELHEHVVNARVPSNIHCHPSAPATRSPHIRFAAEPARSPKEVPLTPRSPVPPRPGTTTALVPRVDTDPTTPPLLANSSTAPATQSPPPALTSPTQTPITTFHNPGLHFRNGHESTTAVKNLIETSARFQHAINRISEGLLHLPVAEAIRETEEAERQYRTRMAERGDQVPVAAEVFFSMLRTRNGDAERAERLAEGARRGRRDSFEV